MKTRDIKEIEAATEKLENIGFASELETLEGIHASAEEAFEDRSESWQESEKGEEERERIDALGRAIEELQAAQCGLEDALDALRDASNA